MLIFAVVVVALAPLCGRASSLVELTALAFFVLRGRERARHATQTNGEDLFLSSEDCMFKKKTKEEDTTTQERRQIASPKKEREDPRRPIAEGDRGNPANPTPPRGEAEPPQRNAQDSAASNYSTCFSTFGDHHQRAEHKDYILKQ